MAVFPKLERDESVGLSMGVAFFPIASGGGGVSSARERKRRSIPFVDEEINDFVGLTGVESALPPRCLTRFVPLGIVLPSLVVRDGVRAIAESGWLFYDWLVTGNQVFGVIRASRIISGTLNSGPAALLLCTRCFVPRT